MSNNFACFFMNRSLGVFVANHVGLECESRNDPHCELRVVCEPFAMSAVSIAVKKNNPLFFQVSEALQMIKAKGLTDFIQEFWVSKNAREKLFQLNFR